MDELARIKAMTPAERYQARLSTSMVDVERLVAWLRESGREYLILRAEDLVRGMGLQGVPEVQNLIARYREHRAMTRTSGRTTSRMDPLLGVAVPVAELADDRPTLDELCAVYVQIREQLRTEAPERLADLERP